MRLLISKTLVPGLLLLCVCALAACSPQDGSAPASSNNRAATTNGNAATAQTAKQPATQTAAAAATEARRITIEETQAAIAAGKAVVVDVRDEAAYKASHIKGAKSIPLPRFDERASELAKDKLIITYCAWPSEQTSARAVQILKTKGYENAAALLGGWNAWTAANLPVEKAQ